MYKRIIVTGGTSVVGYGLEGLAAKGEYPGREFLFLGSKECDLLDREAIRNLVAKWKPDAILHFAAIAAGVQKNIEHPASMMRDNIFMNFNVAEAARSGGNPKVLMMLSPSIYPLQAPVPMKEESLHAGYPHESNYGYAFAKRLIDPMCKAYRKEYGLDMIGIIPGAIMGPRSSFNPSNSTALPALIRRFYEEREETGPLNVWGDGSPLRQVTSDEDMARISMWCLDNYNDAQLLNVSTSEEISIKDAAYAIAECLKVDPKRIVFDTSKPTGTHSQALDNSKFMALADFKYAPIRDTIKRTADYFAANYPDPEKLRL